MANSKPINSSMVDLVARGMLQTIRSVTPNNWFGPGQPLAPIAPPNTPLRTWDYPYGTNLFFQPRVTDSGISFDDLFFLADSWDLLRIVIETRKDQAAKIPWTFRVRPKDKESRQEHADRNTTDPRVQRLNDMFRYPDLERDWHTWIRGFLEEVFVIDALALAPIWNSENQEEIIGLRIIDGSTIHRLITYEGNTPMPPDPAYQQVLKGTPAIDLTTRDLLYKPRNYRARKIYGYSPVEQIMVSINTALRRQQSQLMYYTEGNTPEAIIPLPESWTADQIKQMQIMWDGLAGDQAKRSRVRFVPQVKDVFFTKDRLLKDEMDEWLARIVCSAFSLSPTPFIRSMNRATAQNAAEEAASEGLLPLLDYIAGVLTQFVEKYLLIDDIEFAFLDDEESDQLKQAEIDKIYASIGKVSIDELRIRDGQEPIGMGPAAFGPNGPIPLAPYCDGGALANGNPLPQDNQQPGQPGAPPQPKLIQSPTGTGDEPKPVTSKMSKRKFRRRWSY
jgi:hypothetical protein